MINSVPVEGERTNLFRHLFGCDLVAALFLLCVTAGVFFRTIFQGKPISKLSRLANWDSVYQDYANASIGSCDPSLVQLMLPNYFCVAKSWHNFVAPLWNPYSGCGMPMIGDISAAVLAPLHLALAFFPSARTYNLTLVGEVVLCVLGAYLLARLLSLERLPAIFAAISYAFCPYILYYLELLSGTSQALFPLLFASFVWAARSPGQLPLVVASLATAGFVLSGHPESSLYGVMSAVVLYFFIGVSSLGRARSSLIKLVPGFLFVGIFSFALAAPMLLPFVEYLSCGDSYKYGDGQAAFAPWQGIVLNIFQPCYGMASPFLGVVSVSLLPFCVVAGKRQREVVLMLIMLSTICLLLISRVGWLDNLLAIRPLSYLITVYLIPCFLLLLSMLAGIGMQAVSRKKQLLRFGFAAAALPLLVSLSICLLQCNLKIFNFDETLPDMSYRLSDLAANAGLVAIFFAAVWLSECKPLKRVADFRVYFSVAAILVNALSLLVIARYSLPVQPFFDFPETKLTEYLAKHPGRVLSVTEHVLKPNSNIVYGISSLRVHNPMQPARFAEFTKLCGAQLDEFRNQSYGKVTPFVDLASVRYLVSQFKALPERYNLVFTTREGISVYENVNCLPQAYLVNRYIKAIDGADAKAQIQSSDFDPRSQVVIEVPGNCEMPIAGPKLAIVPLAVKRLSCNQIDIDVKAATSSVLVFTDTFYPGWLATVDGRETEILRANYLFRAIVVPRGDHEVRFCYKPLSCTLGMALAALAVLVLLTVTWYSCLTNSRVRRVES